MIRRPYRHTVTRVTDACGTEVVILGTYSTLARAIAAAKVDDRCCPDATREIRCGNRTLRNRYAHGPVQGWRDDEVTP